ncbi:MAG: hypothetical protein V1760_03265 [Candidatus Peregrinibacteria bacterium]
MDLSRSTETPKEPISKPAEGSGLTRLKGKVEREQLSREVQKGGLRAAMVAFGLAMLGDWAEGIKKSFPFGKKEKPESGVEEKTPEKPKEEKEAAKKTGLRAKLEALKERAMRKEEVIKRNSIRECESFAEARQFMIDAGYVFDEATGNYLNPDYLKGKNVLQEALVSGKIGRWPVKLKQSVLEKLVRADEKFFWATGRHLVIGMDFRKNEHQWSMYDMMNKEKGRKAAPPGMSFHEIGQAVDIQNWEEAQDYLIAEGFVGGKIGLVEDQWHFSIGEIHRRG